MRLLFRGDSDALRSSFSFSTSGMIHGAVLALVVFGKTDPAPPQPQSLYDQVIRPHEKQIVWYHVPDRLPDVRPSATAPPERRPLRAIRKAAQRIVTGSRDDARLPQLVWAPLPEVAPPPPAPLPNVLAVEVKAPPRPFTPPARKTIAAPVPELPAAEAPALAPAPAGPNLSPLRRSFTPPPVKVTTSASPSLPDAVPIATAQPPAPAGPNLSPLRRSFTPPPVKLATSAPALPDAAPIATAQPPAPAGANLAPLRRSFTPPPVKLATTAAPSLPEAAPIATAQPPALAGANLAPLRRSFKPPAAKLATSAAPALPDAAPIATAQPPAPAGPNLAPLRKTFTPPPAPSARPSSPPPAPDLPEIAAAPTRVAIIGLDPSKNAVLPAPPAPRDAGFSAGPKPQPDGAATDGETSRVHVPGVTVRDGPTRQSLLAAIRPMAPPLPPAGPLPPTRVSSAPDPMLEGRTVYTLAIQMPNVTSYSGSWLVWYAERQQSAAAGAMRAPSPLRKVDPKYVAAAAAEGVQGVVRLAAVIRKDGRVDEVKLLRHLDDRLDRSAMECLAKWQFEPASRDGAAVDVDAVFEIPFRLAPKLK